ncbi:interferon-induced protein 44-like isoform X2 [Eleginops maclovinus]|uniref:interferon-induced protein 44-like isoform X2 n=1 Tax=Eleginops maclovinus TaxID=56733 RepID=UPI003080B650
MGGSFSSRPPPPSPLLSAPWRRINWSDNHSTLQYVKAYQPETEDQVIRILLHGLVGSGKSSFINSVESVLRNRMCIPALVGNATQDCFTREVNPNAKISKDDRFYKPTPSANDKVHVLVFVIDANKWSLMNEKALEALDDIRDEAKLLDIPQVAILTKIDEVCPEIQKDIKNVYKSKELKEKMEKVSGAVGVPMNCIFPVKNYSKELDLDSDTDALILSALKPILDFGNDHLNKRYA